MTRFRQFAALVFAGAMGLSACQKELPGPTGLQSIKVTLIDPLVDATTGYVGSPDMPVVVDKITFSLEALDEKGQTVAEDMDVDVYLSFGGNKIGQLTACGTNADSMPLTTIHLTAGKAQSQPLQLIRAFGETTLWVEERNTKALGASPRMYFPQPTISDIQRPLDINAPTATYCTPFNGRHVIVDHATGQFGKLVVTSVFSGAYVVADTGAAYDPMVPLSGFNHLYVFTFGKPPRAVVPGLILTGFSGNVSKFNGFTELNFPIQSWATDAQGDPVVDETAMPPVYPLTVLDKKQDSKLLALTGSTVTIQGTVCCIQTGGSVCCGSAPPCLPDDQWAKFNTFTLNVGDGSCDSFDGFAVAMPGKTFGGFNPLEHAGKPDKFTFTGMLQNSSGQNDACKGYGPQVDCKTDADCDAAADQFAVSNPMCASKLKSATCVEGTCRRGVFNFWTIHPRSGKTDDISM